MQSFIIVHTTKEKRDKYLEGFFKNHEISLFDIRRVQGETSLGIEEIRDMQKQLLFKPIKGKEKAIILEQAHTLTIEAQNALLKVLEEPPAHTIFFLSTNSTDSFLPTIISRCSLVVLEEEQRTLSEEQILSLQEDISCLFSDSISVRLYLAEKIASQKDEVGEWLRNIITYLHQNMLENVATDQPVDTRIIKNLQEAYRLVTTTNTNPRMVLEHSFLTC